MIDFKETLETVPFYLFSGVKLIDSTLLEFVLPHNKERKETIIYVKCLKSNFQQM